MRSVKLFAEVAEYIENKATKDQTLRNGDQSYAVVEVQVRDRQKRINKIILMN